jgi:hypothetical protein
MGVIKKGVTLKSTLFEDTTNYYYIGYVAPNENADDKTECIIERIDKTTFEITCVEGSHAYEQSWALRASYDYEQFDGTEEPS